MVRGLPRWCLEGGVWWGGRRGGESAKGCKSLQERAIDRGWFAATRANTATSGPYR